MHDGTEGTVHALVNRLSQWRPQYGRIVFACRSIGASERLAALLRSYGQKVRIEEGPIDIDDIKPPPSDELSIHTGRVSGGFRSPFLSLALVADAEIFGRRARRSSAR